MVKYNLNGMLLLASALSFTACNDPVNGYFAPMQESTSSASGSTAGNTGTTVSTTGPVVTTGGTKSPCTPQMAQNLRILLLVDASGSTKSDDAGAKIRVGSAMNFINSNLSNANLSYSFTYFVASPQNPSYDYSSKMFSSNPNVVFGNGSQALGAVNLFQNTSENITGKGTDYEYALQSVGALVTEDNAANPGKYSYAVIFMSDGQPNVGPDISSTIDPLVTSLIATVGASRITLSSVYFSSPASASDETLIDNMALVGKGQYVNGDTGNLDLNDMIQNIITVPANACPAGS